ncbi:MAG: hypothetical protein JO332_15255 [Planctomycetaceae bacterium]|nr:hypothetical protein [Planctomycetaceae bacterium]
MKIGNGFPIAGRILVVALMLLPAIGCPRKKIVFHLSPSSMLFSAPQDGNPPSDQILTMTGIDEIPDRGLVWSLETDQPWLTVTPLSGLLHAGEAVPLTVQVDQSFLAQGLYTGSIHIVAFYGKHRYPQTLDVTLDVTPGQSPPPIVIDPD